MSTAVYNGSSGVHSVTAESYRQAHTGGLVRLVWTGSLLFASLEGDVARWRVIMKIVTTVALLHLCFSATGEFILTHADGTGEDR